jgi:monothiol glutaredoxin
LTHTVKNKAFLGYTYEDQRVSDKMSFEWTSEELQKVVEDNQIVIFMKGTPDQPQCGFSARGAQVVSMVAQELGIESFACVNVLSDPRARPSLKEWSDFPTIPQIFINGELIGGSDIAIEMYQSGELSEMVASKDNTE